MKKIFILQMLLILKLSSSAQTTITWVETSQDKTWQLQQPITLSERLDTLNVEIELNKPQQIVYGFGTCFNELGWTSLSILSPEKRNSIMHELFAPGVGADFTICRMPIGANDFSRHWYSYDETDSDFNMSHFNIANDEETLIPFIKEAQKYNPSLKLWASPWSPPQWMKYNHHYAGMSILGNMNFNSEEYGMDLRGINNGLTKDKEGKEGTNMFIQHEKYYKAYALYFTKFIEAYKQHGIKIGMVMPQNEFNSAQFFPSCTWTAAGLAQFIPYLGKQMQSLGVNVFFGTMERANAKLVDTVLDDAESGKYIHGVGFQWAGKGAIPVIHQEHPDLTLYQTEQECGNGKNDWKHCIHTWDLMKHFFNNGANAYMYWNTSLKQGGISTWGWKQNSLISVDTSTKTYKFNYEYFLMKHLSHFVKPGAKRLETTGSFNNLLAFINPDKSVVVVVQNENDSSKELHIKIGNKMFSPVLKGDTFNTFLIKQ